MSKQTKALRKSAAHTLKELFVRKPSLLGVFIAVNFLTASLTPSLMPRPWLLQGVASGVSLIIGYAIGVAVLWTWRFLQLKEVPPGKVRRMTIASLGGLNALLLAFAILETGSWQNRVRELVGADPATGTFVVRILLIAFLVAGLFLLAARSIRIIARVVEAKLEGFLPRRVALVITGFLLFWLLGSALTGALRSNGLHLANNIFSVADRGVKDGSLQPTSSLRSSGPESLVSWEELGKQGKQFVGTGPTVNEIEEVSGEPAAEPIRVYASLKSGETHVERAANVLQELIRTQAFERKYLLLTTTTGTGYLDPNAMNSFELITGGDSAIAGMQYSYLPSWIALLADTETPKEAANALFDKVHGYWQTLDPEARPKLYLYGLSLGAYGSQASISRVELLNDPVDGALWAGPPFVSEFWNRVTDSRDEGSPAWLPVYQNGEVIRFTDGEESLRAGYDTEWQDNRIVYLQYPTDPVVFFSNEYLLEQPEWLKGRRGRGVSPEMEWYPFVTYFQLAFDLVSAGSSAEGYGHLYSQEDYEDAWRALLDL